MKTMFVLLLCLAPVVTASRIAAVATAPATTHASALLGTAWHLLLNVGREEGAQMPETWAASGARLPLRLDARFDAATDEPIDKECEKCLSPFGPTSAAGPPTRLAMNPIAAHANFIGLHGEEHVAVRAGAAFLTPVPFARRSGMHHLRFCLELGEHAQHHDVELDPGELYFFADAWDAEQLDELETEVRGLEESITTRSEDEAARGHKELTNVFSLVEKQQRLEKLWDDKLELHRWSPMVPVESNGAACSECRELRAVELEIEGWVRATPAVGGGTSCVGSHRSELRVL